MKIFKDRKSAGQLLAKRLKNVRADLVLGIPRGGVVVAKEVAKALKLPLDVLVTRKIGAPNQPELALGAVDPEGEAVLDQSMLDQLRIDSGQLTSEIQKQWKELRRRENLYNPYRHERFDLLRLDGKAVILVDDGAATGATVLAALKYLKRHGVKVMVALPLASKEALVNIKAETDEAIVLEAPEDFRAVGQFYREFEAVSDEEVVQLLL